VAAGCAAHDEKYPANRAALAKRFAEGLAGSPGSQSRRFLSELLAYEGYDDTTALVLFPPDS
jgi:hypothetical protein